MSEKMSMRDRIKQKADSSGSRSVGYLKLPTGTQIFQPDVKKKRANLNFIPYTVTTPGNPDEIPVGVEWYRRGYKTHRNVGPEEKTVVCLKSIGKRCPVCEEYARLKKDPDADPDLTEAIKPKFRYLYNVIDLNDEEKGVQIWDISEALFQRALDKELKEGEDRLSCFAEIEDGLIVVARFESKSFGGRDFLSCDRVDFKDREEPLKRSILKKAIDLDSLLITYSYDDLKAILLGADEETDSSSEEEDETPRKKAKVVKDEEEEEDETPRKKKVLDEEEEEEEEAPKKKKKVVDEDEEETPRKRRVVDEDEEEEETPSPKKKKVVDEDESEEEEVPKKKKKVDIDEEEEEEEEAPKKKKAKIVDEDEEEEEAPKKKLAPKKSQDDDDDAPAPKKKKVAEEDESVGADCPHGFRFGKDLDKHKQCEKCPTKLWDACRDAHDGK